jgi:ubiquinone/menaquinone biosynthesis C-methylase UbiE
VVLVGLLMAGVALAEGVVLSNLDEAAVNAEAKRGTTMKRRVFAISCLGALGVFPLALFGQSKPITMEEMHKLHQDSKAYIAMLDDPARDAYQKPHEVVMALDLKEGERIADIGAGSGYFSLRFAQHVGATGQVLAVDINPEMIVHLNQRIRDAAAANIRTILALPDDPLLAASSVDRVFICETWHHIGNHPQYLGQLRKVLKPGGQVIIIDFQRKAMTVGPPAEMRVAREDVVREFEQSGFRLAKEHTFLPYQYFLVFTVAPHRPTARLASARVLYAVSGSSAALPTVRRDSE